jgi:hypothetical protein
MQELKILHFLVSNLNFALEPLEQKIYLQKGPCPTLRRPARRARRRSRRRRGFRPRGGGLTPPTRSRESTRQGNAGLVAGGQSGRRTGAAAVAAHRRSRRWDGEHGPRRGARALVDHRGTICLPGRVGGQARKAVDDELKSGGAGEQWLGASEIPAEGRSGLIWLGLRSKRRGWGVYW